jgi:hypothetical protein
MTGTTANEKRSVHRRGPDDRHHHHRFVLSYVMVRLEGTLVRAADRLNKVLIHQDEIIEATNRIGRRIETIEALLDANKAANQALSNRLNGKRDAGSSVDR